MTAGIGWFLRHNCNITIGWPRGGGSTSIAQREVLLNHYLRQPDSRPPIEQHRQVPLNYLMNVCTHSYSLVWYSWTEWEAFIDWLALSGINMVLALTGQEEIQHRVYTKLGLSDVDIRHWFNGPAFLTWSRGQNEYGAGIAGPIPRSFLRDQFQLQKEKILPRLRSLGIVGQLPAFQGNVPIQLKELYSDANITEQGATGWMDSLDPLFEGIAKVWMETLIQEFGTDHWYQLDGYFDGGTAPWVLKKEEIAANGVTGTQRQLAVDPPSHDDDWYQRGSAAYQSLSNTDPDAIWSFQGFAVVGWDTPEQASHLKGFIDSAPPNKFVIMDMAYHYGQWTQWKNASFFGAPFIWTALHDFGGTDGIKGDMHRVNGMPFDALDASANVVGIGATPEGIDQNPAFYEFLHDQPFRDRPFENLLDYMADRALRRYGVPEQEQDARNEVASSWALLSQTLYATDRNVKDFTGVSHLNPSADDLFKKDRATPTQFMCKVYKAWDHLLQAAENNPSVWRDGENEPFRYDLINLGREVMAQISTPMALNFTASTQVDPLVRHDIWSTTFRYTEVLYDLDTLVATDSAFLLGPWLQMARHLGEGRDDCASPFQDDESNDCSDFYEWNARSQITTWNPTGPNDTKIPGGPIDYAGKHWAGLVKDYYGGRAKELAQQALHDCDDGVPLNATAVAERFARHAHTWTTSTQPSYSNHPVGDPLAVSRKLFDKYSWLFRTCQT